MIRRLFLLLSFILLPLTAAAQTNDGASNGLGGYVPPPLFQEPKFPDPKEHAPKRDLRLPSISQEPEDFQADADKTETDGKNLIEERIIKEVPESRFADTPPPQDTQAPPKTIETPPLPPQKPLAKPATPKIEEVKPKVEPKAEPKTEPPVKISKPPPVSSEGVVKGPKTMPSNKKTVVETEPTFEPEQEIEPVDMLQRVQEEKETAEQAAIEAEAAKPQTNAPLPAMETMTDGNRRTIILFVTGKTDLSPAHQKTLDELIIPELEGNIGLSLLVESYASPQDNALSADRRISLSRALAVRQYLLNQKVAPGRIDVRAMGAQTTAQPLDRIELILVP